MSGAEAGTSQGVPGYIEHPGQTAEAKADAGLVSHGTLHTRGDWARQLESKQGAGQGVLGCSVQGTPWWGNWSLISRKPRDARACCTGVAPASHQELR